MQSFPSLMCGSTVTSLPLRVAPNYCCIPVLLVAQHINKEGGFTYLHLMLLVNAYRSNCVVRTWCVLVVVVVGCGDCWWCCLLEVVVGTDKERLTRRRAFSPCDVSCSWRRDSRDSATLSHMRRCPGIRNFPGTRHARQGKGIC